VNERLLILTNAPAPYTRAFAVAMRQVGVETTIVARHHPGAIGRGWSVEDSSTIVTDSGWRDARTISALVSGASRAHVILTGSYTTLTDAVRRSITAVAGHGSVQFWGERLRPGSRRTAALRRCWFCAPGLDGVLAIGSNAVSTYRAVLAPGRPLHVLPYTTGTGLDVPHVPHDRPTIGYAGRLLPYKGVDLLLEATAAVPAHRRPHLEVAGSGPDAARLLGLASQLGIEEQTTWLGELSQSDLAQHRRRWWAQAVPSRTSEGWGVVVNEALNSGVPVLASSHVNAAVDLVRDGRNGQIISTEGPSQRKAWTDAICESTDREVLTSRSIEARRVGSAFSPARAAAWLADLLQRGISGESSSFVTDAWETLR